MWISFTLVVQLQCLQTIYLFKKLKTMKNLRPRQAVPELIVKTTNGMDWNLRDNQPENFSMLIFDR